MATELSRPLDGAEQRRVVAVIGFMGAGKSTAAAQRRARRSARRPVDVDSAIEERLGKPIDRIFAEDGEAAFRRAEEADHARAARPPRGSRRGGARRRGGRLRRPCARRWPSHWWCGSMSTSRRRGRAAAGSGRPLAADRAQFERLHAEREPIYDALADVIVPHERSHRHAPRCSRAAEGLSAGCALLWAASASGDYPAYIGAGLLGDRSASGRRPCAAGASWSPTAASAVCTANALAPFADG